MAIPTASGKSLLAYMGMVKRISEGHARSKAIYIVPLKALAMEKYEDLSAVAGAMGWTVGLGIGDATAEAKNIDDCNILVCTSEKLDSCFDIGQNWFQTSVVLWRMNSIS